MARIVGDDYREYGLLEISQAGQFASACLQMAETEVQPADQRLWIERARAALELAWFNIGEDT